MNPVEWLQIALSGLDRSPVSCRLQLGRWRSSHLNQIFFVHLVLCLVFSSALLSQFRDCLQYSKWCAGRHSLLVDPSEALWINVEHLGQLEHLWSTSVSFLFPWNTFLVERWKKKNVLRSFFWMGKIAHYICEEMCWTAFVFAQGKQWLLLMCDTPRREVFPWGQWFANQTLVRRVL